MKKIIRFLIKFILIFVFAICFKLFLFEIYKIPSGSMRNTLKEGDIIVVNKSIIGARLPRSEYEIPWVNLAYSLANDNKKSKHVKWKHKRLAGIRKIKRGDILVFNPPFNNKQTWVKRCTGLPGDKISVKDNIVSINGVINDTLTLMKNNYRLYSRSLNKLKIPRTKIITEYPSDSIDVNISYSEIIRFGVDKCYHQYKILDEDEIYHNTFSKVKYANYSELTIPYKGMKLTLNNSSKKRYKGMLVRGEGLKYNKKKKEFYQNGKIVKEHIFKNDYYFMMGDNRTSTQDSRSFGAVAEKQFVGVVGFVI